MPENVEARLKASGKHFEILVDLDSALRFRKTGQGSMQNILAVNGVFSDIKKGMHASSSDLKDAFGSDSIEQAAAEIIKRGEIQLPAEYRKKEREMKVRQVVDFLVRNCIDPRTGRPYTPTSIETAMHDAHVNVDDRSVEEQVPVILKALQVKIPIRIETKKLRIIIPASYTGSVYNLIHSLKEKEEWMHDGSLSVIVNLPAGMQSEFYDKLNKITHGNAITQEVKS